MWNIKNINMGLPEETSRRANIERATNLRHTETIAHEVDGVYAIGTKGRDVVHYAC